MFAYNRYRKKSDDQKIQSVLADKIGKQNEENNIERECFLNFLTQHRSFEYIFLIYFTQFIYCLYKKRKLKRVHVI